MSDSQYTFAVAYIRAKEAGLFSAATIDQLMACGSYDACIQFLQERGWGYADTPAQAEAILSCEEKKTWEIFYDLVKDEDILDVLGYSKAFHNLKAAIKESCSAKKAPKNIYIEGTKPAAEQIREIVRDHDFGRLPSMMSQAAKDAYETLLHTGDGQLCDVIIDRACMEAIHQAGQKTKQAIIRDYAETQVAVGNIKVAVRCAKTGKQPEFIQRALAPCGSLNVNALAQAALGGTDAIREYLSSSGYAEAAEALAESYSAFERWCDNSVIKAIRPQKYNAFSVGPVVAYVLARENEIKTVRIILSGKQNGLPEESIRERIREMYV